MVQYMCYHLSCSVKIFISTFALLFAMGNSKKICEEISFPSFFKKNADASIFVELFFCKKIPLSRHVGYVMGGSVSGSVSGSVRDVCMSHQSDWIYY